MPKPSAATNARAAGAPAPGGGAPAPRGGRADPGRHHARDDGEDAGLAGEVAPSPSQHAADAVRPPVELRHRGDSPVVGKPLPDVVGPDLDVLFCGINPSLLSAARGHHFARPGNRLRPALPPAGPTPRRRAPGRRPPAGTTSRGRATGSGRPCTGPG